MLISPAYAQDVGGLLGSLSQQANEVESLLASASPSFLGQNIDIKA